jgi:glycosyltransferase involved in cell wall biosynthesis
MRLCLASGRDLGKLVRKVREFAAGPREERSGLPPHSPRAANGGPGLFVFSPLALPWPSNRAAVAANRRILGATVSLLAARLGMRDYQLWSFLPNVADAFAACRPTVSVYYCTDEWSLFPYVDGPALARSEERLCRDVDVVFAVCDELAAAKRQYNPRTHLAPHGVDHAAFARALEPATEVPADLLAIPRPRIGFYGTLHDWVDMALLRELAQRRPEWSLVLIGAAHTDVARLAALPNVHLLGRREHRDLPAYCKGFDAGIVPYRLDDPRMRFVNPIKAREYLSAGLPVISTPVPEVERLPECTVASGAAAFEEAIARALRQDCPERRRARSERMRTETWQHRVADIAARVLAIEEAKCHAAS